MSMVYNMNTGDVEHDEFPELPFEDNPRHGCLNGVLGTGAVALSLWSLFRGKECPNWLMISTVATDLAAGVAFFSSFLKCYFNRIEFKKREPGGRSR